MPAIQLRPREAADDSFLFDLFMATDGVRLAAIPLPEAQRQHLIRLQYTSQESSYAAQFPGANYEIVLYNGRPAGKLWVARLPHEIHLADIALLPELRGQGIGTFLFRQLMSEAAQSGKPLRSSVFRFNEGSLRLHLRLGFRAVHEDEMQFRMEWTTGTPAAPPITDTDSTTPRPHTTG